MKSIEIRNISKKYDGFMGKALDDVSLYIEPGELFFLLGPSGCGKTTLLRIIAGLLDASGGKVLFGDSDVTKKSPEKRSTAMVFQNYALWPHMTVKKNIAFALENKGCDAETIRNTTEHSLKLVGMNEYANRKPNELSGGQQQRVALARAIAAGSDFLLFDEPLSNLDAALRAQMRLELRDLIKKTGKTAVYVTHDQAEAMSMADRVAVMKDGKVVQVARPQELYCKPANEFVANFIGQANFIDGTVVDVGEYTDVQTECGTIWAQRRDDIHDGKKVRCCVRPESIELCRIDTQDDYTLPGTFLGRGFMGSHWQYIFGLNNGAKWKVAVPAAKAKDYEHGSIVGLKPAGKEVWLLNK